MEDNELKHFGVLGMKWGRRMARSSASINRRDAADLRKHGYKKEADALDVMAKRQEDKARNLDSRIKSHDLSREKAVKLADALEGLRKQRSIRTKITDTLLSGPYTGKLRSEKQGKTALAKDSAKLHDQLSELRKQRTFGEKIVDVLMTSNPSTHTWSEMSPAKKTRTVAITAAAVMMIGGMNYKHYS